MAPTKQMDPVMAWSGDILLEEIPSNAYLCIAINGRHGVEGAYASITIDGLHYGCPDRAPAFPSNTWEYVNARVDKNYTYYFPLNTDMEGKEIIVSVLAYDEQNVNLTPEVWLTAYPIPYKRKKLILEKKL